jgi:hypothetical protein
MVLERRAKSAFQPAKPSGGKRTCSQWLIRSVNKEGTINLQCRSVEYPLDYFRFFKPGEDDRVRMTVLRIEHTLIARMIADHKFVQRVAAADRVAKFDDADEIARRILVGRRKNAAEVVTVELAAAGRIKFETSRLEVNAVW